jgi:hypothetical protein
MDKKRNTKRSWSPFRIISAAISGIWIIVSSLISDRFTGWGNEMIDNWLANHQGIGWKILLWIFKSPLNLITALAIIILFIILVDWYLTTRKTRDQSKNREVEKLHSKRANIETDGFEKEEFQSYIRTYQKTKDKNVDVVISRSFVHGESSDDYKLIRIPFPKSNVKIISKPGKVFVRYYLRLKNVKVEGVNLVESGPIHARLEYYDIVFKKILQHEEPFWQDRPRNAQPKLIANSRPEKLCLAIREKKSEDLYAFASNMSYPNNSLDPINEGLLVDKEIIHVKVQLYAKNIDMPHIWIQIMAQKIGRGDEIEVFMDEISGDWADAQEVKREQQKGN